MKHTTVSIIGLGVIGGSLGLALKQSVPGVTVVGYDRPAPLKAAKRRRAIDRAAKSVRDAVREADVVFLAAPVPAISGLLADVARWVPARAIVTDTGSVKGAIVKEARKHFRAEAVFIGGHPMAGSEGSGIRCADPLMFQNAVYALCAKRGELRRGALLVSMLRAIGARILTMDAEEHDLIAAAVSHLPQLIAVSMVNLTGKKARRNPAFLQLAAGGFRDITRIASSPYDMWSDILSGNRKNVRSIVRTFSAELANMSAGARSLQRSRFDSAKRLRDSIPRNAKGFLHPLHDVYVWVNDRPGQLARMTAGLFRAGINISDLELLKIREGTGGTFRLSFTSSDQARTASRILRRLKFRIQQ